MKMSEAQERRLRAMSDLFDGKVKVTAVAIKPVPVPREVQEALDKLSGK